MVTNEADKIQDEVLIHYTPRWGNWSKFHNRWVMNDEYKLYQDGRFYHTKIDVFEKNPLIDLTEEEKKLKDSFQKLIDEKESDIAFEMNNASFKVQN